jgi:hypothetical protein
MAREFPIHAFSRILGKEVGLFAHLIDHLLPELDGTRYEFEDRSVFAARPKLEMNRVYWTEMLYRSHWASAGSILRIQRWLSGYHLAYSQSNLLAAAACARGLIEAAADSEHTLGAVPLSLARDHASITAALGETLIAPFVSPELEERLIHFTHARKTSKSETAPSSHIARQVVQYRARLDQIEPRVVHLYGYLCDLTHPGASSVLSYAEALSMNAELMQFSVAAETRALRDLNSDFLKLASSVLMFGLNPAFVTLKLLNAFPLVQIHTSGANTLDLEEIRLWQEVSGLLRARG